MGTDGTIWPQARYAKDCGHRQELGQAEGAAEEPWDYICTFVASFVTVAPENRPVP
jgi:hypothetical protein